MRSIGRSVEKVKVQKLKARKGFNTEGTEAESTEVAEKRKEKIMQRR